MNILVSYRAIPESPGWATGDSLVRAFNKLGHNATPYARTYREGRPLAKLPRDVDLLVFLECNDEDPQYGELSLLKCPKVYWEFDTEMHWEFTANWLSMMRFDKVFLANPAYLPRVPGSIYLPYAVDDDLFTPGNEKREGAIMIGTAFPERVKFCEEAGIELISGVYREDYVKALQKCKIHVHNYASGGKDLLVMRIFETMGCGAALLTEESGALKEHFEDAAWTYTDAISCKEEIEFLLTRDVFKFDPGKIGHNEVKKNHTYLNRARAILAQV